MQISEILTLVIQRPEGAFLFDTTQSQLLHACRAGLYDLPVILVYQPFHHYSHAFAFGRIFIGTIMRKPAKE